MTDELADRRGVPTIALSADGVRVVQTIAIVPEPRIRKNVPEILAQRRRRKFRVLSTPPKETV